MYEAKELTRDCEEEAAVTDTFKQELKAETLLCLPTLNASQSIEFYVYETY